MHWLLDVDNIYQFGRCEDGANTAPAFINTFQRGPQESVWETVTQPSCDTLRFGGRNGYLDLFTGDSSYAKQWKYTNAPDADARVVQVAFQAQNWAKAQCKSADVAAVVKKASKMGDYLRYSLFDKYFKKIGNCVGASSCPAGTGKTVSTTWFPGTTLGAAHSSRTVRGRGGSATVRRTKDMRTRWPRTRFRPTPG